ncbi:MAG: hypothetical protein NC293_13180 [Roseburia sp.]|nr:hypothetical protein [Roseburia sp.]
MKTTKKFLTAKKFFVCLLAFALSISSFTTTEGNAATQTANTPADTVTVSLRIEDSGKTLLAPTQITLTPDEIATINQTWTVETSSVETGAMVTNPLLPEHATAAHVIASYMLHESDNPTEDLIFNTSYYDGSHNVAHIKGEKTPYDYAWSYRVNHAYPVEGSMDCYSVQEGDYIVLFYSECYDNENYLYTNYSFFDRDSYETTTGNAVTVTLKKDDGFGANIDKAADETITVSKDSSVIKTVATDENGAASLSFDEAGTYTITSERYNEEGLCVNSRAYATITVTGPGSDSPAVNTPAPGTPTPSADAPQITPSPTPDASQITPSPTPDASGSTVKKPAAPQKVKATVTNKRVTLSWKKVKDAKGYIISRSKKNKKNFKPFASTKKTTITKKLKKGKYFFKIRSYKTVNGKKIYSKYSKTLSVKIK